MSFILTPRRPDSLSVEHRVRRAGCPEAIAQWATFGEREDNWFQRNFDSDEAFALRNSGQRERE